MEFRVAGASRAVRDVRNYDCEDFYAWERPIPVGVTVLSASFEDLFLPFFKAKY